MKFDKRWVIWAVYFVIELTLLRLAISGHVPDTLPTLDEWRRQSLFQALASFGAVLLGAVTWQMRWSMRPKLLRVIMVILMIVGVAITVLEGWRVYQTSRLIAEEKLKAEIRQDREIV